MEFKMNLFESTTPDELKVNHFESIEKKKYSTPSISPAIDIESGTERGLEDSSLNPS